MASEPDPLIAKLIQQLYDEDPVKQRNAIGSLRLHGKRAICAIPVLRELLGEDDLHLRTQVHRALECLRREAA